MVKRDSLKSCSLSEFGGSNPPSCIGKMKRKIINPICIDFEGVISEYDGWKDEEVLGKPMKGAKEFIEKIINSGLKYSIFTTRPIDKIESWIKENYFPKPEIITYIKIKSPLYIDDRCIKFDGDFDKLIKDMKKFNVYWEKEKIFSEYL